MPVKDNLASVAFHFQEPLPSLKDRIKLKAFLLNMFKKEAVKVSSLQYIFCSDEYLLDINKQFLQHDFYTDIITFNLAEKNTPVAGEIYISVDRVKDNAGSLNQSFKRELHRVIFHGVLHLCGYKDKNRKQEAEMRAMEDKYLSLYFKK
ncbi:MAG: rRNA maturation RNase YbeY [Chitinophagaceae bacterium]